MKNLKKALLILSGKPLTLSAVANKLLKSEEQVKKLQENNLLMGIPAEKFSYLYPAFQFQEDNTILPGLNELLQALNYLDIWMQLQFLQTGNIYLAGQTPIAALKQSKLKEVLFAAKNYTEMQAK